LICEIVAMSTMSDDARVAAAARFVGRIHELSRVDAALDEMGSKVLWIFGPGGIGKSTLTRAMVVRAAARGCRPAVFDLRTLEPTAQALDAAIRAVAGDDDPGRRFIVIDTFERVAGLETWARANLLDLLPGGTVVVIAGRQAPGPAWRADPLWGSVLEVLPLRALGPDDATMLLRHAGVDDLWCETAAPLAHGHPLALVLLADVLASSDVVELPESIVDRPDLLAGLLGRIVDDVPSQSHRRVLDVAAMTRATTRGLIRHVLGPEQADDLFEWFRTRSFVENLDDGLRPHELAREVLEAELRRTDPDGYAELHHRIRQFLLGQQDRPGGPTTMVQDIIYLHRYSSMMSSHWDWTSFGAVETSGLRPGDEVTVTELVTRHAGVAEAPILQHWMERQPDAFTVVRTPSGEILGLSVVLILERPTGDDLAIDPAIRAIWDHASRNDPPRPGQVIGVHRYYEDREAGQTPPSPTFNVVTSTTTTTWLTTPGLSWFYIAPIRDAGLWAPMMSYLDFHPVHSAEHHVGDTVHHVFCHDWRRLDPAAWLDLMESRELGAPADTAPQPTPILVALTEDAFAEAVRVALRDLPRPGRLRHNPLASSRVVRDSEPEATLADVLRQAQAALPDDPRTEKARRALDRTYFHGATSQEAAAEALHMAFSTYRRHLKVGIDALTETLWQWELYGRHSA
jgi:hypothetical protein